MKLSVLLNIESLQADEMVVGLKAFGLRDLTQILREENNSLGWERQRDFGGFTAQHKGALAYLFDVVRFRLVG